MSDLLTNILMWIICGGLFAFFLVFWLDFVPVYKLRNKKRK